MHKQIDTHTYIQFLQCNVIAFKFQYTDLKYRPFRVKCKKINNKGIEKVYKQINK